jgi:thiol:disulfide interchange protein DsbD
LVWLSKLTRKKIFNRVLVLLIAVVIGLQINKFFEPVLSNSLISSHSSKYAWNENIEDELQQDNQAYLINFTAAWCITCQANDKIALSRPRVKEFMAQNNIEYIVADWTNKDTSILKILNKYDRSGVPLYVYWKPGMSKPKILPAILTESIVIESLK